MRNANRISAVIILGICAYFWYESTGFTKFGSLFPQVVVAILGFLALLLLIMSFIKTEKTKVFEKISVKYINIVIALLLIISWGIFIRMLGFVVTSVLFFSVIIIIFEKRKQPILYYLKKIGMILVTVGVFYFFFSWLLLVPFPKGVLF